MLRTSTIAHLLKIIIFFFFPVFTKELFKGFEITSLEETVLGGNMWKKDLNRLKWSILNNDKKSTNPHLSINSDEISTKEIVLNPMQIRSFVLRPVQIKSRHPFLRVF